jgi:hypothetical protein
MKHMKYDNLLPLFLSLDGLRPAMLQANHFKDGYVYATDAHSLIRIKPEFLEKEYPAHEKTPNFSAVIDTIGLHNPVEIQKEQILKALIQVPKEYDTKECKDCEGEGYLECDLGHQHDCEGCSGEGCVTDSSKPKIYPKSEYHLIEINNSLYSPHLVNRLVEVMDFLKLDSLQHIGGSNKPEDAQFFKVGNTDVLLMPMRKEKLQHKTIYKVEIETINA